MIIRTPEHHSFSRALLALVLFVVGCGSSSPVGSIAIGFPSSTVPVGGTMQLRAMDTNFLHVTADATATATWSSSNPAVLSVNSSGLVTGVSTGYATIKASLGQDTGAAVITVTAANPTNPTSAGLILTPANASVYVGGGQQYTAVLTSSGTSTDVTASTKWSVAPTSVATISSSGVLKAVAAGAFTVTGVNGSKTSTADGTAVAVALSAIAISPATATINGGNTQQFLAIGTYNDGSSRDVTSSVTWASSNTTALTIDKTGLATAPSSSTAYSVTVTATQNVSGTTVTGSAAVQVAANAEITSLLVTPTSSSIATGSAEQHTATAYYSDGSQKDVTKSVTWTSTSSTTSSVNSKGTNVAGTPGMATLTASLTSTPAHSVTAQTTSASPQASATTVQSSSVVIVTPATITSLNIRASKDLFPVGSTQPVQLIGTFSDGTQQDLSLTANWQTSDPSIATIDSTGLATGITAGPVVFSASFGGLTASTVGFQVLPSSLVGLIIDIDRPVIVVTGSNNFRAIGTYSDGTTHDLTRLATWQSTNPASMPVDSTGFGYGLAPGTAQVVATVQGFSAIGNILVAPLSINSIDVLPTNSSFALGTTQNIVALGHYSNGAVINISSFSTWRSEDPTILTIDANGRAKAGRVGTTRVTVTRLGLTQESADITVSNATLAFLVVLPTSAISSTGTSGLLTQPTTINQVGVLTGLHYSALGVFSDGTLQDVSNNVVWNTSDNTVASIDTTGFAIGMKPGSVQVSASLAGQSSSLPLNVTSAKLVDLNILPGNDKIPLGVTRQFSLIGEFDDGTTQDFTQDAVWTAPTPTISDVTLKGQVIGQGTGQGIVTAQYASFSDSTPVTVSTATLVSTALAPTAVSVRQGSFILYADTGTFSDGQQVNLALGSVFNSGTPMVGQMLPSGVAYARSVGTAQIASTYQGAAQSTPLTVTTSTITGIAITPASPSLVAGATQQFTAIATYADGTTSDVSATPFTTWTSSNPSVLSVSATGLATASTTAGTAVITLSYNLPTSGGTASLVTTASTTVTVRAIGNPTALQVTPTSAHIAAGTTKQLTATAAYADGTTKDVTSLVTWTSTNPATATVSATGLVTAVRAGTVSIQAITGTLASSSIVVVSSATVQTLTISPTGVTFDVGVTQKFTLMATFSDGSSQDVSSSAAWTSSNTAVATVDSTGLATGVAAGPVDLTASYGGLTATSSGNHVTATTNAEITTLVVRPTSSSIATGSAEQHIATAWYSDGTQKDVTKLVTWSSSDSSTSAVSATGMNTAGTPGTTTLQASIAKSATFKTSNAAGGASPNAAPPAVTSSSVVIVTPATVTSIAIRATRDLFPVGSTQPIQLNGTFSDGSTQDLSLTANWQSSDTSVATIDQTGLATGIKAGNIVFTASFGGLTASTIGFQVLPSTLIAATIAVDYPAQLTGIPEQLHFIGTYSDGSTHDLTELATFVSADPTIFATSSSGLAYGVGTGSTQVTGTALGFKAIIQLASYKDPVNALKVFPSQARFALGTHLPFNAVVYAQDPATGEFFQDVTPPSVWTSSDPTVLTIDANGVAKSGKVGTTTVSATLLGVTTFSDTVTVTNATLKRITLSHALDTVAAGTGQNYTATGFFSDGSVQDITQDVIWNTSDNTIASIDSTGLGLGMKPGQVQVTATLSGITASTPLTVTNATLSSLALLPGDAELPINVYKQYALIGTFSDGSTQDLTYGGVFLSPTPGIVAVYPQGVATGTFPGIGQISAQFGYFTASTPVNVTGALPTGLTFTPASATIRVGGSQQFVATGTFSDGYSQPLNGTAVLTSSAPLVAPATQYGLIYGTSPGTATLTASIYGQTKTANITVLSNVLSSITLGPNNPTVSSGSTLQLTATGVYDDASTDNLTSTVNWTVSDSTLATINSSGLLTAVAGISSPVTVTVVATAPATNAYPTITSSFIVTINPSGNSNPVIGNPTAIQVTPTSAHIAAGTTKQLTATAAYADGSTKDVTSLVAWTSNNPATATVSATGLVTAIQAGTVSIQAQAQVASGTLMSSSIVIVSSATLQSLAISPSGASFAAGSNQQFTLTGTYSDGTTQNLTSSATWTSSAANVATISSTGLATGVAPGTVQFTGSYGGLTVTSASNTVTPATLLAIILTPSSVNVAKGTTQQFTVTGVYSDGSTHDLTTSATYATSDPTVVGINQTGLATATGAGSAQITVSFGGKTASTQSISVTPAVLASIAITPQSPNLAKGTTQQFTAIGTFTDRTTQDLTRQVVWTSGAPQVMTIDQNGLASSSAIGSTQIMAALNGVTASTGNVVVTAATLVGVTLSPDSAQIAKGSSQQFTATGTFTDGTTQNLSSLVTWTSSNGSVVSVDANGLATGTGIGSAQLTASYQGKTASTSSFQVTPATLTSISFNPAHPSVAAGTTTQVSVIGTYSDGTTQDLTSTATFSSSNTAVAAVNAAGVVKGVQPGTSTITVMAGGQTSSFDVNVSAATVVSLAITPANPPSFAKGTTEQFTATATFSDGTTQNVSSGVSWVSSDPSVFTIDGNGLATGVGTGSASLAASVAGQSASTPSFQVTPATVVSIAVTPRNPSIASSSTQQFTATATYTDNSIQDVTNTVVWSSANAAVLSVSPAGLATASSTLNSTTVALTASLGTSTGSTNVTVLAGTAPPASPMPVNVSITPTSAQIAAGTMKQLAATATYADGTTRDITASVTWSSTGTNIASVSTTGLVTGLAPGTAGIQAQVQGQYGVLTNTSIVIVTAATLQSVAISPSGANFAAGSTQQFTLTGTYSDGTTQNLTSSATWSSSNQSVATISATGLATGVGVGSVQFTAAYGGMTVTSAVNTVTPATLVSIALTPSNPSFAKGTSQQLTVVGTYSDGSTRDLTSSATYASTDPTVVSVSSAGLASGVGIGSAQVTVTVGGQSASTQSVTVTPAVLSSISITPQNGSLADGTTQQFSAIGTFTDGTTQDLTQQAVWTSSNPQVLTIDRHGLATGGSVGSVQVSAAFNGVSSSTGTISVTPATLVSITLSPTTAQIAKGTTQQFTATGVYTDGTTQNLTSTVAWSSSDGSVVSIDGNGLATGTGVGSAQLTASYLGKTATTSSFAVTPATLVSLSFNPSNPTVASGTSTHVTVLGVYSDGTTQDLSSTATLSSSNPAVASVGANGLIQGNLPGTSTITVTAGGQTSSFNVAVSVAILTSISITPANPPNFAKGTTEQFTATGTFSDGSTQDLSTSVSWASSNTSIFTVNSNGLATGVGVGSASLSASYGGQTATTPTFQVTPAVVASVAVTPQNQSLTAGSTQQYTATATYTDSTTADVSSTAVWSSSNTSVATVNSNGLASAIAAGNTTVTVQISGKTGTSSLTVTAAVAPTLQQIIVTPASTSFVRTQVRRSNANNRITANGVTPGNTQQFLATGVYSDQSTQDLTAQVIWSSSLPSVATINSTGLASAVAAGTTSIQAQLSGLSGSINFTVTVPAVTLQSITITPSSGSIAKGNTQQFTATGLYSDGSTQTITTQVAWQSSVPAVATIDNNGLATSVAGGNTQVWASLSGQSAVATLTISPATLTSLAVTPQTASIASGTTQQYKAIGTLSDGSTQDLTSSVNWSTSNSSLATVNASGLAVTAGTGTASIVATAGSVASTATLTVTTATATSIQVTPSPLSLPAGGNQQLLVTATFTDGSSQNVTSAATFASSNSSVVTVDSNGNLKAVGPGTATVTIMLNGVTTTLSVTVGNATVTSIAITPQNPTLAAGQSQQLSATATYSDGSTEDLTSTVTWASSNSAVATVSSTGNIIVAQAGTATISATFGGTSSSTTITGTAAVATAIAVSPASTTLAAGQTQQFAATATMSDGTQQTVTTSVHWSVSDPTKATVSNSAGSNGLLTSSAAGTLNVVASLNGVSGAAAVTVQPATLTSLTINPSAIISLPAGTNQQLSVTGAYSDGSSANVTSLVTWSSSQASTAYVDTAAVLHAVSSGVTTISASTHGVTGTSVVTVGNATLRSIAITPGAPVLALGQTVQLTATGSYSDGSSADITSQVQWGSGTSAVATVSGTGLVTTLATGSSSLNASLNGVSQSTALTVTSAVLQSIAVQVANGGQASFALGTSLQLKAVGTYSDGSTQDLTSSVTWSSQTPAVGVVSSTGLATGVTPGTFNAKATKNGVTGSTSITVASASLVSIAVTPNNAIIVNLSTTRVQFTATGTFSDGSTQNLTNSVHWGTAGVTVGSISSTGVFSPTAVGVGQITASLGSVSGTCNVVVVAVGI